jgi:topoisomerase-4 subunit A
MNVFPLNEVPEMTKGKGVKLHAKGLIDAKAFNMKEGLTFMSRGVVKTVDNVKNWLGKRAQTGKLPPNGFPSSGKFE